MIAGLLAPVLLLLPMAVSGQAAFAPTVRDPLLETYIEELVAFRIGGTLWCDPPGEHALFAKVARRLSAIKAALIVRFGTASVADAEAAVEPAFADVWGGVSLAGCKIGDAAWDRSNLRDLRRRHYEALEALERALDLARKRRG